jgi:hypothetical protein
MNDWAEIGQDRMTGVPGLALFVHDGTLGHYHHMAPGEAVEQALADYAAGYDSDRGDEIEVDWHMYKDGKEAYSGRHAFEMK